MLFAITIVVAMPVEEEEASKNAGNLLFHQINDILKREIMKETKNDSSLEVGDKIKSDDGKLQINVQHFSNGNGFPVYFQPKDKEVLDDKKIIPLVNHFDGSSEYEIKKDDSSEVIHKTPSAEPTAESTSKHSESSIKKVAEISQTTTLKPSSTTASSSSSSSKASSINASATTTQSSASSTSKPSSASVKALSTEASSSHSTSTPASSNQNVTTPATTTTTAGSWLSSLFQ